MAIEINRSARHRLMTAQLLFFTTCPSQVGDIYLIARFKFGGLTYRGSFFAAAIAEMLGKLLLLLRTFPSDLSYNPMELFIAIR